jgi:hypothetical protein
MQGRAIADGSCLLFAALVGFLVPVLYRAAYLRVRAYRLCGYMPEQDLLNLCSFLHEYVSNGGNQAVVDNVYVSGALKGTLDLMRVKLANQMQELAKHPSALPQATEDNDVRGIFTDAAVCGDGRKVS